MVSRGPNVVQEMQLTRTMVALGGRRPAHGVAAQAMDSGPTGRAPAGGGPTAARREALAGRDCPAPRRQPGSGDALEAASGAAGRTGAAAAHVAGAAVPSDRRPVAAALAHLGAWRGRGRVRYRALDPAADRRGDPPPLWGPVPLPLARGGAAGARLEPPAADLPRAGARRGIGGSVAAAGLAPRKKGARRCGRAVVFVDETGHTFRARFGTTW